MAALELQWWWVAVAAWWVAVTATALAAALVQQRKQRARLPPGPWPLPIIGNMHQMSELPHQALWHMAEKYGPIMYMRMGTHPLVVASTADAAQEFVKVQDKSWAGRPQASTAGRIFSNNFRNIVIAPYGSHWRHMRKICMLELFTQRRMESFRPARDEEFALMVKSVYEDSADGKPVMMTVKLGHLASNNITRMLLGKR